MVDVEGAEWGITRLWYNRDLLVTVVFVRNPISRLMTSESTHIVVQSRLKLIDYILCNIFFFFEKISAFEAEIAYFITSPKSLTALVMNVIFHYSENNFETF